VTSFVVLAALMALAAMGALAWPLWRHGRHWLACTAVILLVPIATTGLYTRWSNFNWRLASAPRSAPEPGTPTVEAMVASLEQRLAAAPNDLEGWLMLGRSDLALNRIDGAVNAFMKAHQLGRESNPEAALGLGQALAMQQGGQITPAVGRLFEQALALAPTNPKALFFAGFAAADRGDSQTARDRWLRLKAQGPPAQIAALLDARIAALGASRPPVPLAAGPPAVARLRLIASESYAGRIHADTPLFLFARIPGQAGPPLAVKRLTGAALGTVVELSAADTMIAGTPFAAGMAVAITARVSPSGQPTSQRGDFEGALNYTLGRDGERALQIDHEIR
jgi:cytochrome c-type biogenesis protein CcmH